jgi:hypothetical protein
MAGWARQARRSSEGARRLDEAHKLFEEISNMLTEVRRDLLLVPLHSDFDWLPATESSVLPPIDGPLWVESRHSVQGASAPFRRHRPSRIVAPV